MGKVIMKRYQGMNWLMKTSLVLLLTLATSVFMYEGWYMPKMASAAPTTTGWTNIWHSATALSGTAVGNVTVPTGSSNRMLVVAFTNQASSSAAMVVNAVTYGGVAMTSAGGDVGTSLSMHSQIYYLKNNAVMDGTARPLVVNITGGGTLVMNNVWYAIYDGVDQVTTPTVQTYNSAAGTVTAAQFATGLVVPTNGAAAMVGVGTRATATVTYTQPTNFTVANNQPVGTTGVGFVATSTTAGTDTANVTSIAGGPRWSQTAIELDPAAATNGTLAVSTTTQSVSEAVAGGNATISVTRSGGSVGAVGVSYTTANGTAAAGSDYTTTSGTLSWIDGDATAKTITVPILNDAYDELSETFTVTLSTPTGGATLGSATQTVTITDDDTTPTIGFTSGSSTGNNTTTPAVFTVTLSAASGLATSVNYATTAGSAVAGTDYTTTSGTVNIPALSTTGTINVPILSGGSGGTFTLTLSSPTNATLGTNPHVYTITAGLASTINSCAGCHGYKSPLTFTDNATTRDATAGTFRGSHNGHVQGSGMLCSACHIAPAGETAADYKHSNGTVQIAASIAGGTYGKASFAIANSFAPSSCSNTTCHGTGASPTWGNNTTNDTCTKCHGTPSASPASVLQQAPTTPASAAHFKHMSSALTGKIGMRVAACSECHENVTLISTSGHMDGTKTIQYNGPIATSQSTTPTNTLAGCATTWCHGGNTTKIPQNKPTNRTAPVWGTTFGTTSVLGDALGASSTDTGSGRCAQCHGFPPATSSHVGTSLNGTTKCLSCHSNLTATGTFIDPTLHINGSIEGGDCLGCHADPAGSGAMKRAPVVGQFASQSHHVQKAGGITKTDCYVCHGEADASGNTTASHGGDSASGSAVDLNIHVTGARGATYVAYTANSANAVAATRLSRNRTQMAKITTHCLSCHNSTNTAYNAFSDGKTPISYAWDGKSAGEKYIQTGTAAWGKFNFSGGTTPVGGTNAKNAVTKALSAHGNAANNAMSGPVQTDTTITNISGSVNVLCYDCHNSHGSAVAGITSQYSSATGRNKGGILKDIVANTGGYTAAYKPAAHTASGAEKNTYAAGASLCFDCHSNPTAGTAPIAGYTASGTLPWGYNSTFGASQPLNGYYDTKYFGNYTAPSAKRTAYKLGVANAKAKPMGGHYGVTSGLTTTVTKQSFATTVSSGIGGLCTPCHDPHGVSTNATRIATPANAVPLLKGTWVTSPYKEDKADIAVQRGGGSRYAGLTAGGAIPGYHIDQNTLVVQPNPTGSGGATTASAKSANRSQTFAAFATSAATLQTFADTDFAGLCTQCHQKANITNATAPSTTTWKTPQRIHQTVKGWAAATGTNTGNVIHAYTCSKCHTPHTSRLPRLMVTNCLDVNHFKQVTTGGTISATPGTAVVGNLAKPVTSGGAGRFPAGGVEYTGAYSTSYNGGPWWFEQTAQGGGTAVYGSNCHNATNAGGTAYNPTTQQWNTKTPW